MEELMLLNCGDRQDSQESLGQQRDPTSLSQSSPEYSFEGLMLKLKLQYFGHLMQRTDSLYERQQKRHRCIEQSFGLCERGRGWDDLGEWH